MHLAMANTLNPSAELRHEALRTFITYPVFGLVWGIIIFALSHLVAAGGEYFLGSSSWFAQSRSWILLMFAILGCSRIRDCVLLLCIDGPRFMPGIMVLQVFTFTLSLMFSASLFYMLNQGSFLAAAISHPLLFVLSIFALWLAGLKTLKITFSVCLAFLGFLFSVYTAFRVFDNRVASLRYPVLGYILWPFFALFYISQAMAEMYFDNEKNNFQSVLRSMPFAYARLPASKPRMIRLLRSKPRSIFQRLAWSPRPIEFELFHVDLDEAPYYEAVSYLWGSETRDHQIIVNERTVNVTENAFKVLQQRGNCWRSRTFWIDTICINQDDKTERGKQVLLMSDIYSNAWRVAAWLGGDAEDGKAIALLHYLWLLLCYYDSPAKALDWLHWSTTEIHDQWITLADMLRQRWFSRIWVLQEVVVGQKVHIIYGNQYIDWDELADILSAFNQDVANSLLAAGLDLSDVGAKDLPHIVTVDYIRHTMHLRMRYQSNEPLRMAEAVIASTRGATDDRDRIYGLLSMLSDEGIQNLVPDYEKSTEAVFIEAAQHIVRCNDLAWLLPQAGIGYDRKLKDLPSWIPDFICPPRARTITYFSLLDHDFVKQTNPRYWASGKTRLTKLSDDATQTLTLRGFSVDIITGLGPLWNAEEISKPTYLDKLEEMRRYFSESFALAERNMPVTYARTGQSIREAFWRTLIADIDNSGTPQRPAPDDFGTKFESAMSAYNPDSHFAHVIQPLTTSYSQGGMDALVQAGRELKVDPQTMQEAQVEMQEADVFRNAFAYGRRVCVTSEKMLGLAPPKARCGDLVVILYGVQVPYILRLEQRNTESSGPPTFRLVGEAYIHGIMDGELVGQESGKEQDFCIF